MSDLDKELERILKCYKRYPYGNEQEPHLSGDEMKQAVKQAFSTHVIGEDRPIDSDTLENAAERKATQRQSLWSKD